MSEKWRVVETDRGWSIEEGEGSGIVSIVGYVGGLGKSQKLKNARLLAASKELLEAAQRALKMLEQCDVDVEATADIRAAIEKATTGQEGR